MAVRSAAMSHGHACSRAQLRASAYDQTGKQQKREGEAENGAQQSEAERTGLLLYEDVQPNERTVSVLERARAQVTKPV